MFKRKREEEAQQLPDHWPGTIDIDIDKDGHVVRVWYGCRTLPFRVSFLTQHGEREPIGYGSTDVPGAITGLDIYYGDR